MSIVYEVASTDVSLEVEKQSLTAVNRIIDNPDSASFALVDPDTEPTPGNSVEIFLDDTSQNIFAGVINLVTQKTLSPGKKTYAVNCSDFIRYFDKRLVVESFETNKTVDQIINTIVTSYTDPAIGFTQNNVDAPFTLLQPIVFNYRLPSEALRELAETLGYIWYIDKDRDVHFISKEIIFSPFTLNDDLLETTATNFQISVDYSQIRNRVFVRGGYNLTSSITQNIKTDGTRRSWTIDYKPHDLSITVGGVSKTLGQENIDVDDGTFEYMYNFFEKVIFAGTLETTPVNGVIMAFTFKSERPLLARVDEPDSIALVAAAEDGDGMYEYIYKDLNLTQQAWVFRRAQMELKKHAFPKIRGSFISMDYGFVAGHSLTVDITGNTYNGTYVIQEVTTESIGNNNFLYRVEFEGDFRG